MAIPAIAFKPSVVLSRCGFLVIVLSAQRIQKTLATLKDLT
jgi:hypothetical protein